MTKSSRLTQLLEYLKDDPADPFNHYAVATEYRASEPGKSLEILARLKEEYADYLPTYYHLAELLIEFERKEEAESVLEQGIELAKSQSNQTAIRELQNLLNQLMFED